MDELLENESDNEELLRWGAELEEKFGDKVFDIWKESMTMLRHLSSDVWNGVRFFLTVNGFIIAASALFLSEEKKNPLIVKTLACIGIVITAIAIMIMIGHKRHYNKMLKIKTLLEASLGFYKIKFKTINLSFSWSVKEADLNKLVKEQWGKKPKLYKGLITPWLIGVYGIVLLIYLGLLLLAK